MVINKWWLLFLNHIKIIRNNYTCKSRFEIKTTTVPACEKSVWWSFVSQECYGVIEICACTDLIDLFSSTHHFSKYFLFISEQVSMKKKKPSYSNNANNCTKYL